MGTIGRIRHRIRRVTGQGMTPLFQPESLLERVFDNVLRLIGSAGMKEEGLACQQRGAIIILSARQITCRLAGERLPDRDEPLGSGPGCLRVCVSLFRDRDIAILTGLIPSNGGLLLGAQRSVTLSDGSCFGGRRLRFRFNCAVALTAGCLRPPSARGPPCNQHCNDRCRAPPTPCSVVRISAADRRCSPVWLRSAHLLGTAGYPRQAQPRRRSV